MSSSTAVTITLPEDKEAFKLREAGAFLGVSVSSIRRWTVEGHLPALRTIGGHRRIPRHAVEALAAQMRAPR